MRIGQLAEATGVSRDTIRYYEKIGLLPSPRRRESGYREYPDEAGNRIRVIRNAVQLGFPLKDIARVLNVRDAGGAPCRQVRDYAHGLIGAIDQQIAQLKADKRAMLGMIRRWDIRLAHTPPGARALLLEQDARVTRAAPPKHAHLRKR
jgi:MerR family transcriptional regulator, Zn(II)-responsive regulator of zntA